jgi:DNA-binding winged helix-turn-helix (wHTH) protein
MTHNDLRYGFAPYQLDPAKRILTRDGEATSLAPKATEIRLVLVKHAGRLVPKDELRTEVWPAQYSDKAPLPSKRALYKFEAVRHHRLVQTIHNKIGVGRIDLTKGLCEVVFRVAEKLWRSKRRGALC